MKTPTRKSLYRLLWSKFSKKIRTSNLDGDYAECYTCQNWYLWKEMDAGHRFHGKLDFDFRNIHPQCVRCNKWLHGNLGEYTERLIKDYGIEWYEQLKKDAAQHKSYKINEIKQLLKDL